MSGGYFDYYQYRLHEYARKIDDIIKNNKSIVEDEYGDKVGKNFSDETIAELIKGIKIMQQCEVYMQRMDYLLSCDDSEESFHSRLKKELDEVAVTTMGLLK